MSNTTARSALVVMVVSSLMLVACGGSSYSRQEAIDDMIEGGLDQPTAECVIDGVEDNFSIEKLESSDDLSDEDEAILLELTTDCFFGADSADGGDDVVSDDNDPAPVEEVATTLFGASDFAPVCRGIGIEVATPYQPGDGLNHVVALIGEDPTYSGNSVILLDGWEAHWEEIDKTELVVCLNRVSTTDGELCDGYKDDESGLEWTVQTFGATYEISLRDSTTAEVVAETTMSTDPDDCPFASFYSEGDPTPIPDYATPDDALEVWLAEYVVA